MQPALPLFALTGTLRAWPRFSRAEMGLSWGNRQGNLLALLCPLTVLGILASVAFSPWHVSAVSLDTGFDLPSRQTRST